MYLSESFKMQEVNALHPLSYYLIPMNKFGHERQNSNRNSSETWQVQPHQVALSGAWNKLIESQKPPSSPSQYLILEENVERAELSIFIFCPMM